jgi:TPR repeat protein
VATFLVAVALLAGGIYWLSQNLDWRDTLPAEWLGRDADPAAATSAGTDADGAAADGEDAESLIADAAPGEQADHGTGAESEAEPAMPAVPRPSVRVVELSEGVAPLPDDASPELRETARRAQEGDPQAQHDLATLYAIGQQVSQDYERAAFWFARAADAGIVNAVYNLGVLTQRGDGVEQDSAAAFRLFRRAAEEGHAQAQYALGLAYVGGRGVDRDLQEAASWFQAASANGFPRGAYYLGRLYEEGFEGEPDPAAAAGWYRIAAEAGDPDAEEALERLTDAGTEPAGPLELEGSVPVPDRAPEPEAPGGTAAGDGEAVELSRDDIREIQTRLDELGYDPGPVDGLMGDRTESAIAAFQQDRGLEADGEPSPALLDRLREAEPAG